MNAEDDNGVLVGKWEGQYKPYAAPWEWLSSSDIFEKYMRNRATPVRYGQCWVFGAITTSVFRVLGIPSRLVVTFQSANDNDLTLTIDNYENQNGQRDKENSLDSVWNFHVWTEAWMKRPDLGERYYGWQAVDGTPQAISDDFFQNGPAPVLAIKEGNVAVNYDAPFIYAEVNADTYHYRYNQDIRKHKLYNKITYE